MEHVAETNIDETLKLGIVLGQTTLHAAMVAFGVEGWHGGKEDKTCSWWCSKSANPVRMMSVFNLKTTCNEAVNILLAASVCGRPELGTLPVSTETFSARAASELI